MSSKVVARWECEVLDQAMGGEIYLAGLRAGGAAAGAEWPRVERRRSAIVAKATEAMRALFGTQVARFNAGYGAGWMEGYGARCAQLDQTLSS